MKLFFSMAIILLMLSSCSSSDDPVNTVGGSEGREVTTTAPAEETESTPTPDSSDATSSSRYHHYNPDAYEMKNVGKNLSFVLCPGDSVDSVSINGMPFTKHGSTDHGRQSWVLYGKRYIGGTLVWQQGGKSYSAEVQGHGMQFGSCR